MAITTDEEWLKQLNTANKHLTDEGWLQQLNSGKAPVTPKTGVSTEDIEEPLDLPKIEPQAAPEKRTTGFLENIGRIGSQAISDVGEGYKQIFSPSETLPPIQRQIAPETSGETTMPDILRPIKAQAYKAAEAVNKGVASFSEGLDIMANYIAQKTGLPESGHPFKKAADFYNQNAEFWNKKAQEVGSNVVDEMIGSAVGGAVPGISEFMLNLYGMAPLAGAAKAAKEGKSEIGGAISETAKTALLAGGFKALAPYSLPIRTLGTGALFGTQAAVEGQPPSEIATSAGAGMLYGLAGSPGGVGVRELGREVIPESLLVKKDVKTWSPEQLRTILTSTSEAGLDPEMVDAFKKASNAEKSKAIKRAGLTVEEVSPTFLGKIFGEKFSLFPPENIKPTEPVTPEQPTAEAMKETLPARITEPIDLTKPESERMKTMREGLEKAEEVTLPEPTMPIAPVQPITEPIQPKPIEPVTQPLTEEIDREAHEAATSPLNKLPEPTEAQIEAGNFKKGHINIQGLDISIENPKGSTRTGVTAEGEKWESALKSHYGYIRNLRGKTSGLQNAGDRLSAYAEVFSDPIKTKTFQSKGFNSLSIKDQRMVEGGVLTSLNNRKIFNSIVKSVPVDVMNSFMGKKVSTEELFHNPSMLLDRLSSALNDPILSPSVINFLNTISIGHPLTFARLTTKEKSTLRMGKPIRPDTELIPASLAKDIGGHEEYITISKGKDKEHIDTFIGEHPESKNVFVVNQINPKTGKFDEHKAMIGFQTENDARIGYLENYEPGWKGLGSITPMSMEEFKTWTKEGDTTKPVGVIEAKPIPTAEKKEKTYLDKEGNVKWHAWINQKKGYFTGDFYREELFGKGGVIEDNPSLRFISRKETPGKTGYGFDQLAEMAHAEGLIPNAEPETLLNAMRKKKYKPMEKAEKAVEVGLEEKQGKNTIEISPTPEDKGAKYLIQNTQTGGIEEYENKGIDDKGRVIIENGELHRLAFGDKIYVNKVLPKGEEFKLIPEEAKSRKVKPTEQQLPLGAEKEALKGAIPAVETPETALEKATREVETRKAEVEMKAKQGKLPEGKEVKITEPTELKPAWETGLERPFAFDPNSTKNEGRFRLLPSDQIEKDSYFRRKSSTEGISYLKGKDKDTGKEVTQAIRFNKNILSEEQAREWWEKNKDRFEFNRVKKEIKGKESLQIKEGEGKYEIKGEVIGSDTKDIKQLNEYYRKEGYGRGPESLLFEEVKADVQSDVPRVLQGPQKWAFDESTITKAEDDNEAIRALREEIAKQTKTGTPDIGTYQELQLSDPAVQNLREIGKAFGKKIIIFRAKEGAFSPEGITVKGIPDAIFINIKSSSSHLSVLGKFVSPEFGQQREVEPKADYGKILIEKHPEYKDDPKNLAIAEKALNKTRKLELFGLPEDRGTTYLPEKLGLEGAGIKTHGVGITAELANTGYIDLRGRKAETPQEVAVLSQIFRNPQYETFRLIYVKNNRIVAHEGITSRLPGSVMIVKEGELARVFYEIKDRIKRLGADGIWLVHNHPSGNPTPSSHDIKLTRILSDELPIKGHVIIDSGKYAVINKEGLAGLKPIETWDFIHEPRIPHRLIGAPVNNSRNVANIARKIKTGDYIATIYSTSDLKIRAIQEIPSGMLRDRKGLTDYLRGRAREFGSTGVILSGTKQNEVAESIIKDMIRGGTILDYVEYNNETPTIISHQKASGATTSKTEWIGQPLKRYRIAEEEKKYEEEESKKYWESDRKAEEALSKMGLLDEVKSRKVEQEDKRGGVAFIHDFLQKSGVTLNPEIKNNIQKDINFINKWVNTPKYIAEKEKTFEPVYNGAKSIYQIRDKNIALLIDRIKDYMVLPAESKAKVDQIAEECTLDNKVLKNDELAQRGLSKKEIQGYWSLKDTYNDAFDMIVDLYVELGGEEKDIRDELGRIKYYVPLSRFGDWIVTIRDSENKVKAFEAFENRLKARRFANQMVAEGDNVTIDKLSKFQGGIFEGIDMATLSILAKVAKINPEISEPFLDQISEFFKGRGFRKHFYERKKVPGYSQDWTRVHSDYIVSLSNYIARLRGIKAMKEGLKGIDSKKPDLIQYAQEYIKYIEQPKEEAAKLRSALFLYYLGANVKSSVLNLTQPITTTIPYLTQYAKNSEVIGEMSKASRDIARCIKLKNNVPYFDHDVLGEELSEALKKAEGKGIAAEQMVYELMAKSRGEVLTKERMKVVRALTYMFSTAETFNRRLTFISAYNIGKGLEQQDKLPEGIENIQEFAEKAVEDTQFVYGRFNRPKIARGKVGATFFTFKTFTLQYMEMLSRMFRHDKKAFFKAIGIMAVLAGVAELPFADDLKKLFESITRTNLDTKARDWSNEVLGDPRVGELMLRGITRLGPIDMSGAIGIGDIVPEVDTISILGPAGGVAQRFVKAMPYMSREQYLRATETISPEAIRNPLAALRIAQEGQRNIRGQQIFSGEGRWPKGVNVAAKALGFQPSDLTRAYERERAQAMIGGWRAEKKKAFIDRFARAYVERDTKETTKIRQEVREYNKDKRSQERIFITPANIRDAIRRLRLPEDMSGMKYKPKQERMEYLRLKELFK